MPDLEPTKLHNAAMRNNYEYLQNESVTSEALLDTYLGNTPLLWGVANSSVSFVLALLDLPDKTHVNVKSTNPSYLNTPLILSVSKGWTHVATEGAEKIPQSVIATNLLQRGAEVNAVDALGRTALHYACLHRNFEAIVTLVNAGATWDIRDKNNQTPLECCCLDYGTASNNLQVASGGPKDYTYTLVRGNFDSSDIFYQSLSSLLAEHGQFVDAQLLKQSYEFNKQIDSALVPLLNHAKKLFHEYATNHSFEHYAKSIMRADSHTGSLFNLPDSIGCRKLSALLTIYFELKNNAAARIDCSHKEIILKKREIEQILNNALENPQLTAERKLITRVGMAILNLVSILCAGLPLLANYCITGQVFFSHQTKTEKLLNHLKNEMTACTPSLGQVN